MVFSIFHTPLVTEPMTQNEVYFAIGIFLLSLLALVLLRVYFQVIAKRVAKRTNTHIDSVIIEGIIAVKAPFYLYTAFYITTIVIPFEPVLQKAFGILFIVIFTFYASKFIRRAMTEYGKGDPHHPLKPRSRSMVQTLSTFLIIICWIIALLLILSNLDVNITPLLAGVSIGGIAIAFALQRILEDLFSSFSIYLDRPFVEGDFIRIGNDQGIVKKIGIKSTRLQTIQGEELIISNKELTNARVYNARHLTPRSIEVHLSVSLATPHDKLNQIKEIIADLISKMPKLKLERVHLKQIGSFQIDYEIVYQVDAKDYREFLDIQEGFYMKIKEVFDKEGIQLSLPMRT